MKAKTKCWMLKRPSGHLAYLYAGCTRKGAIERLLENLHNRWDWKHMYREGRRAVRVIAREI